MANNHLNSDDFFNCLNNQIATLSIRVQSLEGVNTISSPQTRCWCGEWGHLVNQCPSNPKSFNFVGNNNHNIYYPYTNNYNAGWIDHPNFGGSNDYEV